MSFAVVKGHATESQLRVDALLDAAAAGSGRPEDRYSLAALLFTCLRDMPQFVNTIECSAGDEMLDKSIRAARAMQAAGVAKGDVVIINGTNHLHLAVPYYASLFLGALPFHIDFNITANEMRHYVNLSDPKIIFADSNKIRTIAEAISGTGLEPQVVSFGQEVTPDYQSLVDFICDFSGDVDTFRLQDVDRADLIVLACTSGSTGNPKAAALSNCGMLAPMAILNDQFAREDPESDKCLKFALTSSSQWLSYNILTNLCTVFGYTKPEMALLAPGIAAAMLQSPDFRPDDASSLRMIITGGANMSAQLQVNLKGVIHPGGRVVVGYGSTESAGTVLIQTPSCPPQSLGKEVNIFAYKIVDESEKEVPVGETGELWVRGKSPMCLGYLKDDDTLKDIVTSGGWLKTGDLIYRDENGYYFYVERKKLLIKSGLYHIYPAEVEQVIAEVAGVGAAGVCWTERGLAALVAPRPGAAAALTAQHVHDAVKAKLSNYKQLDGGVYFVPRLPQTVSNKLDRGALKATVAKLQVQQ